MNTAATSIAAPANPEPGAMSANTPANSAITANDLVQCIMSALNVGPRARQFPDAPPYETTDGSTKGAPGLQTRVTPQSGVTRV